MKRSTSVAVLAAFALLASVLPASPGIAASRLALSPVARVWSEPSAGYGFLDQAILHARRTIDLSLYELSDPTIERELIARARAGVAVRVLLNADYEGRYENASAASTLKAGSVDVAWASAGTIFHAKYALIDGDAAYIGTGNLVAYDYPSTRDFWVEDTRAPDVAAITSTFDADFFQRNTAPLDADGLLWSPGSTSTLVTLISSATRTLLVENEEMDNTTIESALEQAARRGVDVKVVMTYSSEWSAALSRLRQAGVRVATLGPSQIYIHAKVICADCSASGGTVFIGSENFSVASLDYNRELGVLTNSPAAVSTVERAVDADYATGRAAS
jgi:phosphatidylserine/phosphatidylglycerophosphate/cardiolipin synthase-like enzyme